MATVSVKLELSDDVKALLDRIPENFAARLAECERVLVEICDHHGLRFDPPTQQERE